MAKIGPLSHDKRKLKYTPEERRQRHLERTRKGYAKRQAKRKEYAAKRLAEKNARLKQA